jgi:hypothetical protein
MRIRILGGDRPIAFDGQTTTVCPEGSEHVVSDDFAAPLVRDGWAELVDGEPTRDTKVVGPAETQQLTLDNLETKTSDAGDDEQTALEIRTFHAHGISPDELAIEFKLTREQVDAILAVK